MKKGFTTIRLLVLSLFVLCFWTVGAQSMTTPQTIQQLSDNSTHIVQGVVLGQSSQWDPTGSFIYTTYNLRVDELHKGATSIPETITLFSLGGVVNDTGLYVEHAAHFEGGEDVILFLVEEGEFFIITSWELGRFTILNDKVIENRMPVSEFIQEIKTVQR